MTEAMPFLQKFDITFLRPPLILEGGIFIFSFHYFVKMFLLKLL